MYTKIFTHRAYSVEVTFVVLAGMVTDNCARALSISLSFLRFYSVVLLWRRRLAKLDCPPTFPPLQISLHERLIKICLVMVGISIISSDDPVQDVFEAEQASLPITKGFPESVARSISRSI